MAIWLIAVVGGGRRLPFGPKSAVVLFVAAVFHPVGGLAVELLLNGDMAHRRGWRRAMPMLLSGRNPDDVTRRLAYGSSPAALAVDQSLRALAVPGSLDRNLRCGALDVAEIAGRKFHFSGPDVLLDARQLRGTWDGNHPRLLSKHPGERGLGWCRFLALSDCIEQVDHGSIRLPGLLRKTRYGVTEVGAVKAGILVDLSREVALAQWAEGNKADSEFFESRNDLRFRLPPPQRVFALQGGDRLDGVSATNRVHSCLGKPKVLDLAFPNQVLHRSRDVFDRHLRIDTMLIEQIDGVDPEPLERRLGDLLDVLRPAVQASLLPIGVEVEPKFGRNRDLPAEGSESFTYQFLIDVRAVHFRGIEERYAAFHGSADHRDHLLLVLGRAVTKAHSHAAQADRRNFQAALSQLALLHCFSSRRVSLHFQVRAYCHRSGIPILPIYCPFLLGGCSGHRVRKYPGVREHNY